jgi:hypothetical protein
MFAFYNSAKGEGVHWGAQHPKLTAGHFVATCHAINSGLLKLSALTPYCSELLSFHFAFVQ